jgi:SNF2 family DNA or RNA helicase
VISNARIIPLRYQAKGTEFLISRRAVALFDEQGLGKSKQLIDAVAQEVTAGTLEGALIVCPNTLKANWAKEIGRYSGLSCAVFGSGKTARRLAFSKLRATFYIVNYEAVVRDVVSLRSLLRFKRLALVLDESHRIKTPNARVTRAVHRLSSHAAKRVIMTGTPVANKPEDLWSQLFFLDGGATLGTSFGEFRRRYCSSSGGYIGVDELRRGLLPIALRRLKVDTLDLPLKYVIPVPVLLQGRQREIYNRLRQDLYLWVRSLSGEEVLTNAENILVRLLRLVQLAANPKLLDSSYQETPAKVLVLDQLLGQLMGRSSSQKAIVWTSFLDNIAMLCKRYAQFEPVPFHGEMNSKERDLAIGAFLSNPRVRLFIANPAAGREGLTLTSANVAIYFDRSFNLVDYLQSQDRIHRLTQRKVCQIYVLVAKNTVDEFIEFVLAQKHRLARYVQRDSHSINGEDLTLTRPDILRALLAPTDR